MSNIINIYIPNETSANSVGANMLHKTISNLIKEESVKIIRNGSWGAYWLEPFIEIEKDGVRTGASYRNIDLTHLKTIEDFFLVLKRKIHLISMKSTL